jgi:hypothetical protein
MGFVDFLLLWLPLALGATSLILEELLCAQASTSLDFQMCCANQFVKTFNLGVINFSDPFYSRKLGILKCC